MGTPALLRVASHIDANKHGNPAFLAVITGWGFAYRRPDDVLVIPIGALASSQRRVARQSGHGIGHSGKGMAGEEGFEPSIP